MASLKGTAFLLPIFLIALVCTPVFAQDVGTLRQKIDDHSRHIENLEKEIAAYEKELTTVSTEKRTLESAVKEIDLSRKKVSANISREEKNIAKTELQLEELDGEIDTTAKLIARNTAAIGETLRRMYARTDDTPVESMLLTESMSDLWEDADIDQQFQGALREHVGRLSATKETLEGVYERSREKHQELVTYRKNLVAQKQALDVTKREKDTLLSGTKRKESDYQKLLQDKKAAKEAFERALNELESELAFTLDPSRIPPAGKGVLRWPLDTITVTQKFGNTDFARSGAYNGKGHNGVDFRASVGTPVKAALSGTVVGSGDTDRYAGCYSYGKWVLVRHGNGLSTLYAHLSQITAAQGTSVDTGDILGLSGNTGYSTGPHLHFSVYASEAVQVRRLGELRTKTSCALAPIPVAPLEAYLNPLEYL